MSGVLGIGSNSCGPDVLEKYQLNAQEFEFELTLIPASQTQQ